MKKNKLIASSFFVILFLLVSCKEKAKNKETNIKIEEEVEFTLNSVNESTVKKEDNVFVINQTFSKENDQNSLVGDPVEVDLSPTSGAMISAYSEYKDEYIISLKTLENNVWSDWIELKENEHVENPNRKVFAPLHLKNSVQKIQFKSNKATDSNVIFRIFTFKQQ